MKARAVGCIAALLLVGVRADEGQEQRTKDSRAEPTVQTLEVTSQGEASTTPVAVGSALATIRCDDSGNVYFRVNAGTTDPLQSPVVRVSPDGKSAAYFDVKTAPEVGENFSTFLFTVDSFGRVYQLVLSRQPDGNVHNYLVAFSNKGAFSSKAEFRKLFEPYVFLALASGGFLISGFELSKDARETQARSITGIFDADGRMQRDLSSPEDDKSFEATPKRGEFQNAVIQTGDARLGPEGNVYLLKGGSTPRIVVLSETGSKIRELRVAPPMTDGQALELAAVLPGKVVVRFQGPSEIVDAARQLRRRKIVFAAYDPESGVPLVNYHSAVKGMTACIDADRVTFLTPGRDGKFAVLHGELPH